MARFNASSILNKLTASTKAVDASLDKLQDSSINLVTKWFEVGNLASKMRETLMWNLFQQIESVMDLSAVEVYSFPNVVKPYFEQFNSPEAKAFAKLDKAEQMRFAKGWSEVVSVTKATGKKASERRKERKDKATEAPTYRQVLGMAKSLTTDEKQSLLLALGRELGISAKSLRVA